MELSLAYDIMVLTIYLKFLILNLIEGIHSSFLIFAIFNPILKKKN